MASGIRVVVLCICGMHGAALASDQWADAIVVGEQHHKEGRLAEAGSAFSVALKAATTDERSATALYHLGAVAQDQGSYSAAARHLGRALDIWTKLNGPSHGVSIALLTNLITVHLYAAQVSKAEKLARNADALFEASDRNDLSAARLLHAAASVAQATGDRSRAESLYGRVFDLTRERVDAGLLLAVRALNNRALLRLDHRNAAGAEADLLLIIGLVEERLGRDDAMLVKPLSNLAYVYRETGRRQRALETMDRALTVGESRLRPDDPLLGQVLLNAAAVARERRLKQVAAARERRARDILDRTPHIRLGHTVDIKAMRP